MRSKRGNKKLSDFVDGVSQEQFLFLLAFFTLGILVFLLTPMIQKSHQDALKREDIRKKREVLPSVQMQIGVLTGARYSSPN